MSKKLKMVIAAVVDPEGNCSAVGWAKSGKVAREEAMDSALDYVGQGEYRYWITVELPIPEAQEVTGKVEVEVAE